MTETVPPKQNLLLRSPLPLWLVYAAFVAFVLFDGRHNNLFDFTGRLGAVKALVLLAWLAFLAYSVWCSYRENFMRSMKTMIGLKWGRQVGFDLYLGLSLALIVIYLHGGIGAVLLWVLPLLLFANLATLLYFAVYFDEIVALLGA